MEELKVIKSNLKCDFCGLRKNDFLRYGVTYKLGKIVAHYYCVLLSSKLCQNGKDDEGILGFLYKDILHELKKSSNILCYYCNKKNASVQCAFKNCKKKFHFPCGLKNGCLSQFIGSFKSFCKEHSPVQNIPKRILKEVYQSNPECCICYENIRGKTDLLWAQCCLKTLYHKICVQKLAFSAGYLFRCPACNNVQKFRRCVQKFGIFIPKQDASWELVPNAYEELLFRYNKCDAQKCLCPRGRKGEIENTMWEIVLCVTCGSQGIHLACGGLNSSNPEWECWGCEEVTKSIKLTPSNSKHNGDEGSSGIVKLNGIGLKKRRRGSEDLENLVLDKRKKFRQDVQEEEIEVDVETVDGEIKDNETGAMDEPKDACKSPKGDVKEVNFVDTQDVLTSIRPGPLCYKLGILRKALITFQAQGNSSGEEKRDATRPPILTLSDSEEETEADKIIGVGKRSPETPPTPISPNKTNAVKTDSNGTRMEESLNPASFSREFPGQQKPSHSLNEFEIVALVTVQPRGDQEGEVPAGPINNFVINFNSNGARNWEKHLMVYPLSYDENCPWYVTVSRCSHETVRNEEGLIRIDDE